jgi:hypothetical protein
MRKVLFAILALLCFAVCVRADTLTFQDGEIIIPDGSTVISSVTEPGATAGTATPFNIVTFSFADGTGLARGDFNDGDNGIINFTVPVTSLTINWVATGEEFLFEDSSFQMFSCSIVPLVSACPESGTFTFTGAGITSITWGNFAGFSGIESMSYTLATPEPAALVLLAIGLCAIFLSRQLRIS